MMTIYMYIYKPGAKTQEHPSWNYSLTNPAGLSCKHLRGIMFPGIICFLGMRQSAAHVAIIACLSTACLSIDNSGWMVDWRRRRWSIIYPALGRWSRGFPSNVLWVSKVQQRSQALSAGLQYPQLFIYMPKAAIQLLNNIQSCIICVRAAATVAHNEPIFNGTVPLDTRRCCDVESTSMTLIQRRTSVVCPSSLVIIYERFSV